MAEPKLVGSTVTVRGHFGVEADPPTDPPTYTDTDPTTVTLFVRHEDEPAPTPYVFGVDPNIVRESLAHFRGRFQLTVKGKWYFEWRGDIPTIGTGLGEGVIVARAPRTG